jgi:hypothetical protein
MTTSPGDMSAWPPELALLVEEACNRFEAAWRAGEGPRIEAYLGDAPEPGHSVLLRERLALEVEYRLGGGDTPTPAEYDARFPDHAALIRAVLAGAGQPCPTGAYEPADTGPEAPEVGGTTNGDDRPRPGCRRPGRFTPLRKHAQGGLGTVSVAFDETLRRQVALKAIRPDRRGNDHVRRRFLAEAEITGQLEHPGVVPVYALEEDADGQPYYAMRFVQGGTLADAIRAYHAGPTPLAFRGLLKRFVDVCQTIAYAHTTGVIHRDLKPANVLLGDYGETLVVDWGLAKRVGGGPEAPTAAGDDPGIGSGEALTEAGQVLGTPAYMAPEQAEGGADAVGPAADVYALGAILYEVLTGQPPYRGAGMGDILAQVRRGPPPSPGQVRRGVQRALEAVCLKAMVRSPGDRYAGAREVAREVECFLADLRQLLRTGIALDRLFLQAAVADRLQVGRRPRLQLAHRGRLLAHHLQDRVQGRGRLEGRPAGQALVQDGAQGVHVGRRAHALAVPAGLLRRHVRGRAQDGAGGGQPGAHLDALGQAEVGDLGRVALGQQHVGRRQVAMHDPLAVGVVDAARQLLHHAGGLLR